MKPTEEQIKGCLSRLAFRVARSLCQSSDIGVALRFASQAADSGRRTAAIYEVGLRGGLLTIEELDRCRNHDDLIALLESKKDED